MKKIYLCMLALLIGGSIMKIQAQCTPNPAIGNAYIYPAVLPFAHVSIQYNEVLTFRVPSDSIIKYNGLDVHAHVDSAQCFAIQGIPPGYTYQCNAADCMWKGGSLGCALFTGITTDTSMVGSYPMKVHVFTWAKLGGTPPTYADGMNYTRPDSSDYTFKIDLANGIFEIEKTIPLKTYPNPVNSTLKIELTDMNSGQNRLEIFDHTGKTVFVKEFAKPTSYVTYEEINMSELPSGLYLVRLKTEQGTYINKVLRN